MFTSQNGSTWTADQYSDLAFVIHKANFQTVGDPADDNYFTVPMKMRTAYASPDDFEYQLAYIPTVDVQTGGIVEGESLNEVRYFLTTKDISDSPIEKEIISGD